MLASKIASSSGVAQPRSGAERVDLAFDAVHRCGQWNGDSLPCRQLRHVGTLAGLAIGIGGHIANDAHWQRFNRVIDLNRHAQLRGDVAM